MKLSLINEMGPKITRRQFLGILGKAAAIAYGSPIESLTKWMSPKTVADYLRTFKSSGIPDSFVEGYMWADSIGDQHELELLRRENPEFFSQITPDLLKGFLIKKIKRPFGYKPDLSKPGVEHENFKHILNYLFELTGPNSNYLDGFPFQALRGMIKDAGSEVALQKIMRVSKAAPPSIQAQYKNVIQDWDLDKIATLSREVPEISDFMRQAGFADKDFHSHERMLELLRKNNTITQDEFDTSWEYLRKKRKENERRREEYKKRQRMVRDKSQPRETGHEKKNMLDPRSSRPAQALGPFESRLRDGLNEAFLN